MSELLDTVRRSFYHDVKPGMFIISLVKNSSVSHILTPRKDGKYFRQSLEEAVEIASDIISASQSCIHPVVVPSIALE